MTPEEALELIEQGEGQTLEFKQSFAEENKAIESLCALANADGGTVLLGVSPDGRILGTSIGANTPENFSNAMARNTQPPLYPKIERINVSGKEIIAATVEKAKVGQLFYAFGAPRIRVGRTNQVMAPEQQRAVLLQGPPNWSEERDRPRFEVINDGCKRLESEFVPHFKVRQFAGDPVANLEWRIRGPRFHMEWRPATGSALDRTRFEHTFDLAAEPSTEDVVNVNEIGFEIRFFWHGRWCTEVHRWPIERRQLPQKVLWDTGAETLPPIEADESIG